MPRKQAIMPTSAKGNSVGSWAFLIGVVLAVVIGAGLIAVSSTWIMILALIGVIVGLLNITSNETSSFLMSGAVLIIASSLGNNELGSIKIVGGVLNALLAIFVPATIIVAIKHVFVLARN